VRVARRERAHLAPPYSSFQVVKQPFGATMHIKAVVVNGFKCYGNEIKLSPFSPRHNVIGGLACPAALVVERPCASLPAVPGFHSPIHSRPVRGSRR
jgi:hypothetical protein